MYVKLKKRNSPFFIIALELVLTLCLEDDLSQKTKALKKKMKKEAHASPYLPTNQREYAIANACKLLRFFLTFLSLYSFLFCCRADLNSSVLDFISSHYRFQCKHCHIVAYTKENQQHDPERSTYKKPGK